MVWNFGQILTGESLNLILKNKYEPCYSYRRCLIKGAPPIEAPLELLHTIFQGDSQLSLMIKKIQYGYGK